MIENNNSTDALAQSSALANLLARLNESECEFYNNYKVKNIPGMFSSMRTWYFNLLSLSETKLEEMQNVKKQIDQLGKEINRHAIKSRSGAVNFQVPDQDNIIQEIFNIVYEFKLIERRIGIYNIETASKNFRRGLRPE